ncbi:sulfite exporter TauE/SafE family protein [Mobilitalea sibirica]|uniref:Sulfite exporter TauE/SafE family protein n=1 Tax=Mobilitalea sibirica TaxID=1462919 RepID=A0A8J7HBM1_9FIRM|nr:sulfite exporter TauE/SafE family protein [Mobilitalea sibirica]MBH1940147.1 sulfite exporter TauE/SafE family protein [Mobilitalea sibirica]
MSADVVTKTIIIDGMTCVSCENRIEQMLSDTVGIEQAKVSYSNGTARITFYPDILNLDQIKGKIEELDYQVRKLNVQDPAKKSNMSITTFLGVAVILYALYLIVDRFVGFDFFNAFPIAREGMGYGMLFIIGLLTSFHCVAMCGGICLSQCVPRKEIEGEKENKLSALRPSLLYNLGRVISYTVIGGLVGALGSVVSFTGSFKGIVQIIAGVFMIIMGLNMLNLFPWLRKLNPRIPKVFAKKIHSNKRNNSPLYVGLLNGLMPCGPLQAMQLFALSTGSPVRGALSMFLFSIGTVPLMLAFGALSSFLSKKFTNKMMMAGAVMVVILGVVMFNNGYNLSGFTVPTAIGGTRSSTAAVIEDGVQTVRTKLSSGRYEPITVQKGIPVRWIIEAEDGTINGCNNSIYIPKYDMSYDFVPGENVIEFIPDESGVVPFTCWMGMIRSRITVVEDLSNTDVDTDQTAYIEDTDSEIGYPFEENGLDEVDQFANYTIPTDEIAIAEILDGIQYATINLNGSRISPAVIVVQKDVETTWTINATNINESSEALIFPYYYTSLPLEEGENPVYFIPDIDFDFSAVDYSFFGYVKVVEDINNIDIDVIKNEINFYIPTIQEFDGGPFIGEGPSCH